MDPGIYILCFLVFVLAGPLSVAGASGASGATRKQKALEKRIEKLEKEARE